MATAMPRTRHKTVSNPRGYAAVNLLVQRAIGKVLRKARARGASREAYRSNKAAVSTYNADYHSKHRRENNSRSKQYAQNHRKEINEQRAARRRNDEEYMVECRARDRLNAFLKRSGADKTGETFKLVGCSRDQLLTHLRSQLPTGTTSLSGFDVDHIFPFALYGSSHLSRVMHFSNLQPLSPEGNNDKRARLPTQAMAAKVSVDCWPDGVSMEDLPLQYNGWASPLQYTA